MKKRILKKVIMLNLFKELAKDLNQIEPGFIHGKLSDQQLKEFPDLYYPFSEMIEYARTNWIDRTARDILINDLIALRAIMQSKYELETTTEIKIQDAIILSLSDEVLDSYMNRRRISEVKNLFNPISAEAKRKINESYKRTHTGN
jgi:hypothetical protein